MLQRVCRRLAELYAAQALSGNYAATYELEMLYRLHCLLTLTLEGKLTRQDWDVKKYRLALPYLWLPVVPPTRAS